MRDRRRHLVGFSVAALLLLAAAPVAAPASVGLADGVATLASPSQKPFIAPKPRPTEARQRPTDDPDPNRNAYTVPQAPKSPKCGRFFCVHWVAEGIDAPSLADSDGNGVPNFVQQVLKIAEHVHEVENGKLGWREPKSDGRKGGGKGKTDIYLSQIGGELFGYAAPDRGQATKQHPIPRRLHGYLVLDNDYSAFEFPGTSVDEDLQVTLAHEYNHILQFGYDAFQDAWFAESTATWMEDRVYPRIDDYLRYVRRWVKLWDTPLTTTSIKEYGSAVWNQWLEHRYGDAIVRQAWARAIHVRPGGFSVNAYESAIGAVGRSDLGHDFARFAAAVAEWRTGVAFREGSQFPDMPRQGRLPLNGQPLTRLINHTTFQLLRVRAHGGRAVAVRAVAPRGIATGLALVGRVGSERQGRTVTRFDFSRGGGKLYVRLGDPRHFSRITAVVANADAAANDFSARRLDWRYLAERMPFEVSGKLIR
ncbi:MAG: MXAN_6640 family putative metalloprotease [Solirubrobacterales bacterium]